jgi:hypothetical protein
MFFSAALRISLTAASASRFLSANRAAFSSRILFIRLSTIGDK